MSTIVDIRGLKVNENIKKGGLGPIENEVPFPFEQYIPTV